ncbi:hypothetical protein [Dyadobacter beijingensis]|uniref:hypothetical protein n=1 Tax=Dyadobacter beijingensis TaxID=365489 RepID=UPI00039B3750|nr:hypothetical protein [Dyadobacter beijingensis]
MADTLKVITEHYEEAFLENLWHNRYLVFIIPLTGLTTIHLLRRFLFGGKANKGIKEVLDTINKNAHTLFGVPDQMRTVFQEVLRLAAK